MATAARACDSAASSSSAWREMPSSEAIASAATPWWVCGCRARRCSFPASIIGPRTDCCAAPSAGCSDIISQPPAMTTSSMPDMIDAAAMMLVVMPEPQKRSRVTPLALMSKPASSAAMRARSPPWVPTCMLVPKMTSSTAAVSTSLRSRIAASTVEANRCGWMSASAPLPTLPMPRGVRQASMIQASVMGCHPSSSCGHVNVRPQQSAWRGPQASWSSVRPSAGHVVGTMPVDTRGGAGQTDGGPLAGVRVVDCTTSSGRLAGKLLGEMGAEVVRLRVGESGDPMTSAPGGVLDWWFDGGVSVVPLDLADSTDRATFVRLVAGADILLETEPPGRLADLGLDSATLTADHHRLVHVSLTPFGGDGPRAHWQSSDLVIAAAGGMLSVNGVPDEPVTIWGRQMDNIGGMYAAICALAGVFRSRATGRGLRVDLSHQQAVVSCTEHVLMYWWWPEVFTAIGGPIASRQASLHWTKAYEVVPCLRGHCMVSPSAGGVPDLLVVDGRARPRPAAGRGRRVRSIGDGGLVHDRAASLRSGAGRHRRVRGRAGAARAVRRGVDHPAGERQSAARSPRVLPTRRRPARGRGADPCARAAGTIRRDAVSGTTASAEWLARRSRSRRARRPLGGTSRRRDWHDVGRRAGAPARRGTDRRLHARPGGAVRHAGAGRPRGRGVEGADRCPHCRRPRQRLPVLRHVEPLEVVDHVEHGRPAGARHAARPRRSVRCRDRELLGRRARAVGCRMAGAVVVERAVDLPVDARRGDRRAVARLRHLRSHRARAQRHHCADGSGRPDRLRCRCGTERSRQWSRRCDGDPRRPRRTAPHGARSARRPVAARSRQLPGRPGAARLAGQRTRGACRRYPRRLLRPRAQRRGADG